MKSKLHKFLVIANHSATSSSTFTIQMLVPDVDAQAYIAHVVFSVSRSHYENSTIFSFVLTFADTVKLSDHISQLLDGLHLLLQVLALDEVSQLRIIVSISQLVKVKKRLVDICITKKKWDDYYLFWR